MSKDEQSCGGQRPAVPYSDAAMQEFLRLYLIFDEREKYCWGRGIDCFVMKVPPDLNAWADFRLTEMAADRGYTVIEKTAMWKFELNEAKTPSEDDADAERGGGCSAEQLANKLDDLLRLSAQLKQHV